MLDPELFQKSEMEAARISFLLRNAVDEYNESWDELPAHLAEYKIKRVNTQQGLFFNYLNYSMNLRIQNRFSITIHIFPGKRIDNENVQVESIDIIAYEPIRDSEYGLIWHGGKRNREATTEITAYYIRADFIQWVNARSFVK